ncbi:MAG: endonuclease/exonuclease/phosphatase family protein [Bacteroidales bacterium]|nr:endonuclease/exonuclease/phosphatase family protein [Bacteroidales bacterium]
MKILAYNIHHSSPKKINQIFARGADIYVLPEIASPQSNHIPDTFLQIWEGVYENKGLGIVYKTNIDCVLPSWYNKQHKYIIPLIIDNNWLLIAAWPTVHDGDNKTYPQILMDALIEYKEFLQTYPTLITGDFNCFIGQSGVNQQTGRFEDIIAFLEQFNIKSLYHTRTGEKFGSESQCTYHHMFSENSRFFLDYTFSNIPCFAYELEKQWNQMSDHHPQMIVI